MLEINNFFRDLEKTEIYKKYQKEQKKLADNQEYLKLKKDLEFYKKENNEKYYIVKKELSTMQKDLITYKNDIIDAINEVINIVNSKGIL